MGSVFSRNASSRVALYSAAAFTAVSLALLLRRTKRSTPKRWYPKQTLILKFIQSLDWLYSKAGHTLIPLRSRELCYEEARIASGTNGDLGPSEQWENDIAGMHELNMQNKGLSAMGRFLYNGELTRKFRIRMQVEQFLRSHPDVHEVPINKPLIITGLYRTGTTLLYHLLSLDPETRSPKLWECFMPVPPPRKETYLNNPRLKRVMANMANRDRICPELNDIHHSAGADPEEEMVINTAEGLDWFHMAVTNSLKGLDFYLKVDAARVYRRLKLWLQMLSYAYPPEKHWTLKAPQHSLFLDHLVNTFPDATVVFIHRDVAKAAGSYMSLKRIWLTLYNTHPIDAEALGRVTMQELRTRVQRLIDVRRNLTPEQKRNMLDFQYSELVKDPIATVRKIYSHHGREVTPEFETAMREWLARRKLKHGRHSYSLEEFGLSTAGVAEELRPYTQYFMGDKPGYLADQAEEVEQPEEGEHKEQGLAN